MSLRRIVEPTCEAVDCGENGTFVIEAVAVHPRRPGRFEIIVNGRAIGPVSINIIDHADVRVGKTTQRIVDMIEADAVHTHVRDRALNMLAFRARSARELARGLVRKGESAEIVDAVVARLVEDGLLDDAAFARAFTRSKAVGARQSTRRVLQGLARKGVARDVGAAAVAQVVDEEGIDQQEIVREAARRKLRSLSGLEPIVRKRRLYAFLARRAYEMEHIRTVMAELAGELREEPS